MKKPSLWLRFVSGVLIFNILFPAPLLAGNLGSGQSLHFSFPNQNLPKSMALSLQRHALALSQSKVFRSLAQNDPSLQFFTSDDVTDVLIQQIPAIDMSDPAVDEDPFLMRSQSWVGTGAEAKLSISAPLVKIFEGPDFLLFAPKPGSGFLDRIADPQTGERAYGLFVVLKEDLAVQKSVYGPVPFYFLPLPEADWESAVPQAYEMEGAGAVLIVDSWGESIPIDYLDIHTLVKMGRHNLSASLSFEGFNPHNMQPVFSKYPERRATAGFGTRLMLGEFEANPSKELAIGLPQNPQEPHPPISNQELSQEDQRKYEEAKEKMRGNLRRVGTFLGVALAAAFVFKYTILKERFRQLDPTPAKGPVRKGIREIRQVLDVYVHNLNTVAGIPSIWTANILENFIDRYFSKLGSAQNSLIRRFLNWNVFYSRNTAKKIPLNTKTLIFGAGILGGIDTAFVYLQLDKVTPWMGNQIGEMFPSQAEAAAAAFAPNNALTRMLIDFELIRNISGYATTGAAGFSSQMQDIYEIPVSRMAAKDLLDKGKDPLAPENASELAKIKENYMNRILMDKGLPSKDRFLFDAGTLFERVNTLFTGLPDPKKEPNKFSHLLPGDTQIKDNFWLASRPGLLIPSLERAVDRARELVRNNPYDHHAKDTVKILRGLEEKVHVLQAALVAPVDELSEVLVAYHEVRHQIMLLSYEGTYKDMYVDGVRYVPKEWEKKYGSEAAQLAGGLFRRALMSAMSGEKHLLERDSQKISEFLEPATQAARAQMVLSFRAEYEDLKRLLPNLNEKEIIDSLVRNNAASFEVLLNDAAMASYEIKKSLDEPLKDIPLSRYEKGQIAKARSLANESYLVNERKGFWGEFASAEEYQVWKNYFAEHFVKGLGLHFDFTDLPEGTRERVLAAGIAALNEKLKDPKISKYLSGIKNSRRFELEAMWMAQGQVGEYTRLLSDPDFAHGQSPARPGLLQKLRQREFVRGSRVLTVLLRSFEAGFSTDSYEPGLVNKIYRSIPFVYDYRMTAERIGRRLLMLYTASYAFNFHVWGLTLTYSQLTWWLMTSFPTLFAVSPMFMRLFSHLNWKPMGKVSAMVFYSVVWSWVTFFGGLPQYMYQPWFDEQWHAAGAFIDSGWEAGKSCAVSLGRTLGLGG